MSGALAYRIWLASASAGAAAVEDEVTCSMLPSPRGSSAWVQPAWVLPVSF